MKIVSYIPDDNNIMKIQERCAVIAELVQKMQPMYHSAAASEYQRHHIETIIGAAIWYIPNSKLWTGKISIRAIQSFQQSSQQNKPKLTKDHQYPRKVAARILLNCDWSQVSNPTEKVTKMYIEKFGTFNFVTPQENRELMKYQKVDVFKTPEEAYNRAGIILIKITKIQLKLLRVHDETTIEYLMQTSRF